MRHPHADLMIAYANDMTLQFEFRTDKTKAWEGAFTNGVSFYKDFEYRIKPTKEAILKLAREIEKDTMDLYAIAEANEDSLKRAQTLVKLIKQL